MTTCIANYTTYLGSYLKSEDLAHLWGSLFNPSAHDDLSISTTFTTMSWRWKCIEYLSFCSPFTSWESCRKGKAKFLAQIFLNPMPFPRWKFLHRFRMLLKRKGVTLSQDVLISNIGPCFLCYFNPNNRTQLSLSVSSCGLGPLITIMNLWQLPQQQRHSLTCLPIYQSAMQW